MGMGGKVASLKAARRGEAAFDAGRIMAAIGKRPRWKEAKAARFVKGFWKSRGGTPEQRASCARPGKRGEGDNWLGRRREKLMKPGSIENWGEEVSSWGAH